MRVSKERAAENRERILREAARLFRERGLSGVGVDEVAAAAGLTYGSLYSQFGSKDAMTAEAVQHAFAEFARQMSSKKGMASFVAQYLSTAHRDDPGQGCTVATLASEMPRQSKSVRRVFTENIKGTIARIGARLKADHANAREDDVLAAIATLVGAMVMARAVDDPALSKKILAAARTRLRAGP
jgi:TetR/AcrR family transcriptional repressor of nem operon